jgi:hypothetical protein
LHCNKTLGGCDARFKSTDAQFLRKQPKGIIAEFPGTLTHQECLSQAITDDLIDIWGSPMTFNYYSKRMGKLQHETEDRGRQRYLTYTGLQSMTSQVIQGAAIATVQRDLNTVYPPLRFDIFTEHEPAFLAGIATVLYELRIGVEQRWLHWFSMGDTHQTDKTFRMAKALGEYSPYGSLETGVCSSTGVPWNPRFCESKSLSEIEKWYSYKGLEQRAIHELEVRQCLGHIKRRCDEHEDVTPRALVQLGPEGGWSCLQLTLTCLRKYGFIEFEGATGLDGPPKEGEPSITMLCDVVPEPGSKDLWWTKERVDVM